MCCRIESFAPSGRGLLDVAYNPKAMPWADILMAFQAVATQKDNRRIIEGELKKSNCEKCDF